MRGQKLDPMLRFAHQGDVAEHGHVVHDRAIVVFDRVDGQPLQKQVAVFAAVPYFALPPATLSDFFPHLDVKLRRVLARRHHLRGFAHHFLTRIASDVGEGVVHRQDALRDIGHHHAFSGPVKHPRRQAQLLFGVLALGDVCGLKAHPGNGPIVVKQRESDHQKTTVFAAQVQRFFPLDVFAQAHGLELALAKQVRHCGRKNLEVSLAHHLSGLKTKAALKFRVGKLVAPRSVFHCHEGNRVVHHCQQTILVFARSALRLVQSGVVGKQQYGTRHAVQLAQQGRDVQGVVALASPDNLPIQRDLGVDDLLNVIGQIGHVGGHGQVANTAPHLRRP